ncbi:hypothetical protein M2139_000602 [Enterococcus sp. PF1-24]|uniref:helix-turn-helix domain-containing protein n=1 Tax=unclassified Enterococcus TaxID=2608891 RepID=UPI0024743FE8|nr:MULTISPECIES: helix-turn-helix domain-containing protein [unclassified Enterococcus]MDH6363765.1 hypothetical protein [Enterococcus sp. PFB1-1]MDH6400721.1 hypothetical protein [Enterococcus sp. PF1-24]
MLYEEIMMDSPTLLRFRIFRYLMKISQENFPIIHLAEDFNLNYQQAVIELTAIEAELKEMKPNHENILMGAGKVNALQLDCTIDEYRYYLLQKSVPFQFILYLLNDEKPNVVDFCEKYQVSRSTVSRKMENLKNYLQQYNLRLTYTKANLVGDERLVRVMLFNLIWLGTRGLELPLKVDQKQVNDLIHKVSEYFPLSLSYFGNIELHYFAALYLIRIKQGNFVKYDKRYNFLMKNNSYYDFKRTNLISDAFELTAKQQQAESSFIFFLSHYVPFYTIKDETSLQQTLYDFSVRPNPIYSLNTEFLNFAKEELFRKQPQILDNPLILGNLLNIGFTLYVTEQSIPNIQTLVTPVHKKENWEIILEEKIAQFFAEAATKNQYSFVKYVKNDLVESYKNILLPYFNSVDFASNLKVGLALEHNFLLVNDLHQFLDDLKFVDSELYQPRRNYDYDLVISSSQILSKTEPKLPIYLLDYADDDKLLALYQYLRKLYNQKNLHETIANA